MTQPRVFCLHPALLVRSRKAVRRVEPALLPALNRLADQAEQALCVRPLSVMDKMLIPPSGDKHDYMSFGPYWWPDPDQPDGLPYIRRDGEVNPETRTDRSDRMAFGEIASAIETLSLGYYFIGNGVYAEHAVRLLRTWFLDPATRMNPHLEYGQAIPGRVDGRGIGIIDTARLAMIVDAIGLLYEAEAWTGDDQAAMIGWFDAFLTWLTDSQHGRDEDATLNNHGTWYDVQVASYALYISRPARAAETIGASRERRIATQITADGRQPHELRRTKALGYSIMNLTGMFKLAEMGEQLGIDLWAYRTGDGRCIQAALDYLAPYADTALTWPYPQIEPLPRVRLFPLLRRAAIAYSDDRYELWTQKLPQSDVAVSRTQLLYPR